MFESISRKTYSASTVHASLRPHGSIEPTKRTYNEIESVKIGLSSSEDLYFIALVENEEPTNPYGITYNTTGCSAVEENPTQIEALTPFCEKLLFVSDTKFTYGEYSIDVSNATLVTRGSTYSEGGLYYLYVYINNPTSDVTVTVTKTS